MGKYALIIVSGLVLTFGYVRGNLQRANGELADNLAAEYARREAKLTAHALAHMALAALDDTMSWRAGYQGVALGSGTGQVAVQDWTTDASLMEGELRITARAASGTVADTVTVLARLALLPPGVHGGVTANSVVKTLGHLVVDGRDHDLDGNLLLSRGTMGVSTTQTYVQSGASTGGGTDSGIDYTPSKPANPAIIEEHAVYSFPASPDEVVGYPDGYLRAVAMSGVNGSQYVTDPAALTFPLRGVTYVDLAAGAEWGSIDFGASTGVLVVHNAAGNAKMKNLNGGSFKGLMITDDIEHIHCDLIGAVVSMNTTPSGNCMCNGSGRILYSRAALERASQAAAGGGRVITVTAWRE